MKVRQSRLVIGCVLVIMVAGVVYGYSSRLLRRSVTSNELILWVKNEDNGLLKSVEIEPYQYKCQYLPLEYLMARYPNLKVTDKQKNNYQNSISFQLEFITNTPGDAILSPDIIGHEKYSERLFYLVSSAKSDFKLVYQSDTLGCVNLNYENPYNLNNNLKVMLEFESKGKEIQDDLTLIYHDNLLGGGIIKFHFQGSRLKAIPKLKTI